MSTRSDIIVQHTDGTWKRIYCHFDGYPEGVGRTLLEHYSSQERAEAVVAPGDMSTLGKYCTKASEPNSDGRQSDYTYYYGRDRGETDADALVGDTAAAVWPDGETGTEFSYVWLRQTEEIPAAWWVADADKGPDQTLYLVQDVLNKETEGPQPNIKAFGGNFVIGSRA